MSENIDKSSKKRKRSDVPSNIKIPELRIQNVVSTFYLGRPKLNLQEISSKCKFPEYNPHKFAAATLRIKQPRTTALVFGSGNLVCTGAKTVAESLYACRQGVDILQRSGLNVSLLDFHTELVVGTAGTDNMPIDLVRMRDEFGQHVRYEPDLFPGLIYRLPSPKIVFLLFRSGRVVVTGAKSEKELWNIWRWFYTDILIKYIDETSDIRCSAEYRQKCNKKEYNVDYFHKQMK